MNRKTKGILSVVFGIIGIFILPIIFGPLAIYFGIKSKKEEFKKLGNIGITIGIIALFLMFFSSLITKFIIFPVLGSILNTSQPVIAIHSESMKQDGGFEQWWKHQESNYAEYKITKEQFKSFPQAKGLNVGDILIIKGTTYNNIRVGDVILFESQKKTINHRVVKKFQENGINYIKTKGDNNPGVGAFEKKIEEDQIIGKISLVIPKVGWSNIWLVKLVY